MKFIPVIAIIFFLAFRPLIPVVEYVMNYDQIVREYCINRMQPEMMCKGKCYFFDELSKTSDEKSSDGISSNTIKIHEVYFLQEIAHLDLNQPEIVEKTSLIYYSENLYNFSFLESVFHPPLLIS